MLEWLSAFFNVGKSLASGAKQQYDTHEKHRREQLYDFMLEAIGTGSCLCPDNDDLGTVSLNSIDMRTRFQQESQPNRAKVDGVPEVGDKERLEKIQRILQDMVVAGKLKRGRRPKTWRIT